MIDSLTVLLLLLSHQFRLRFAAPNSNWGQGIIKSVSHSLLSTFNMSMGYGDQTPPRKRQRGNDQDRDPPTPEKVTHPEKDDLIQRALTAIQLLTNVLTPNFGDDLAPFLADVLVLDFGPMTILP